MAVKRDICKISCKVSEKLWEICEQQHEDWTNIVWKTQEQHMYIWLLSSGSQWLCSCLKPSVTKIHLLMIPDILKINSGSMAHTTRFPKNFTWTLISRYLRESAYPSWRVGKQTSCSYFPVATYLFGVFHQAKPTNSFSRILKPIEIMKS